MVMFYKHRLNCLFVHYFRIILLWPIVFRIFVKILKPIVWLGEATNSPSIQSKKKLPQLPSMTSKLPNIIAVQLLFTGWTSIKIDKIGLIDFHYCPIFTDEQYRSFIPIPIPKQYSSLNQQYQYSPNSNIIPSFFNNHINVLLLIKANSCR